MELLLFVRRSELMSVPSKLYSTGKGFFTLLIVTRMKTRGVAG